MNKIITIATLLTLSTAAIAQTAAPAAHPGAPASGPATTSLRQQMMTDLQKAGFTEVKIRPDSFLVSAKDKSGQPVTMFINPDSVTEIVADGTAANGPAHNQASMTGAGMFTAVPAADLVSSKIVGLEVHNTSNQDIGTIKDIAYQGNAIQAYIVGVGGFLGMGDHYVAVHPQALTIAWNGNDKAWQATMNTTADQLKAAPEYKYPGKA